MKLNNTDVEKLKTVLSACKVIGVDGVVIHEGLARGASPTLDAAILTELELSIPKDIRIGIGRVSELEKRISIFQGNIEIDIKSNDAGDVSMLTLNSNKSKAQFRCTSANLMKYPKSNDDTKMVNVTFSRGEIQQLSKATKALGSETIIVQISDEGLVKIECVDSSNDKFVFELEQSAEFIEDEQAVFLTYLANKLSDVLDAASKDNEDVVVTIGESGSLTTKAKGHTLLVLSQINGED